MFDFFKKKSQDNSDSPAREEWATAKEQFDKKDFSNALGTLINGFRKDLYHKPLYELASNCIRQMGGAQEAELFIKAANELGPQTFTELGNHFYTVEHYPLTKIFLEEAFRSTKDVELAHTLAIAYARRFDTKKAQNVLSEVRDKFDFWTFWFFVKMRILNNDRSQLYETIQELEAAIDVGSQDEKLKIPKQKVLELREAFSRLELLTQPEQKIRDWHFVQYGSVILDFFYSEDNYVAGGRHVASWGNPESIVSILQRLHKLIDSRGLRKIIFGQDRDSKILALAFSKLSGLPAESYTSETDCSNSLLFVADSSAFSAFDKVEDITEGNITFAFNQNWLKANFICPDIIGLMSQMYGYPWSGGNIKMNEDGTSSRTEADTRSAEVIAEEIAATEVKAPVELDTFYRDVHKYLKMNQSAGHRYNFMIESPVPGAYFGSN